MKNAEISQAQARCGASNPTNRTQPAHGGHAGETPRRYRPVTVFAALTALSKQERVPSYSK
jgi:hypothetical protein